MEVPEISTRPQLPIRLTLHAAARQYGTSVATLRSAVRERRLRVVRTGRQEWVTAAEVSGLLRGEEPVVCAS